ncbi:MAG: cation transporter [Methylococcaceae bacterium]|nr:MAG: cation transporter [Methylococcaceae bacterium]
MGGHTHHCDHHSHSHGTRFSAQGRALVLAIACNAVFVVVEFICGFIAHSTALMADAGHNLSDVLGLFLAWWAMRLGRRRPKGRYTYGLRSSTILAALSNAMLLLIGCGAIAWEAVRRFSDPPCVAGLMVLAVAAAAVVVNGLSAWLLMASSRGNLNIRGAFLHMAVDAAVSMGVVMAGSVMYYTGGYYWLDPATSLFIVAIVLLSTWGLLRDALHLALGAVPTHIEIEAVRRFLASLPGVTDVHDLHIWGMSTTENALTVHLVIPAGHPGDAFIDHAVYELQEHFAIHHSTLQIELGQTTHVCSLQ